MISSSTLDFVKDRIKHLKIAVIGDVMLDRYFFGEVTRISPEAPVPVNKIKKITSVLGGAGNVAANLSLLGSQVYLGGVTGQDTNRRILEERLQAVHIHYEGLFTSDFRETITKLRIIALRQQMLRLDFEKICSLTDDEFGRIDTWLHIIARNGLDGIIISDYAKGICSRELCQHIIKFANERSIPVLVDPKGKDWSKYTGCSFITPNLKEISDVCGQTVFNEDTKVVEAARDVAEKFNVDNVIVTRSEKGLTLVNGDEVIHKAAVAQDVYDVSGAGDTAAATLLAAIAGGLSKEDALVLANMAAGVVVSKVGTYPIHREELLMQINKTENNKKSSE